MSKHIANFKDKNKNHTTKESRSNHEASFNSPVESAGKKELGRFKDNIDKYIDFVSWARSNWASCSSNIAK